MKEASGQQIDALLEEERRYEPDPDFTAQANTWAGFSTQDPDEFWEREGRERVSWSTPRPR